MTWDTIHLSDIYFIKYRLALISLTSWGIGGRGGGGGHSEGVCFSQKRSFGIVPGKRYSCNFIKKKLQQKFFPVCIAKFFLLWRTSTNCWFCYKQLLLADHMPNESIKTSSISILKCLLFKTIFRSSPPKVFLTKGVLKICSKITGERPC